LHCPVSSAQEQAHWKNVEEDIKDEHLITIAQMAPSVRVTVGEDFGLDYGKIVTGQVVAALRRLGFQYVFDVNFGADITR
jgi:iron only hydrogenase large subunit-like protein